MHTQVSMKPDGKECNESTQCFLSKFSIALFMIVTITIPVALTASGALAPTLDFPDEASIRSYIIQQAHLTGVPPAEALFIAQKESHFDPRRTGDTDKVCSRTGLRQRSRGLWQISDCYHPEIGDAMAYSIVRSTAWAMRQLLKNPNEWSSWRFKDRRVPLIRVLLKAGP